MKKNTKISIYPELSRERIYPFSAKHIAPRLALALALMLSLVYVSEAYHYVIEF